MYIEIHSLDVVTSGFESSRVRGTPTIKIARQTNGTMTLSINATDIDYIGTGERGGDTKEIHREARIGFVEDEIADILRVLLENGLPKLRSADALKLAARLIEAVIRENDLPERGG